MSSRALTFVAPRQVEVRDEPLAAPGSGEVLVRTRLSAVSAGTELLAFRGELPRDLPRDSSLPGFDGTFSYPFAYGYAAVGQVEATGPGADLAAGQMVFAFHPHRSAFVARVAELWPVPEGVGFEDAVFFANLETAASLVHDASPLLGDRIAVVGLGVVGLLTTGLCAGTSPELLVGVEPRPERRAWALDLGAHAAFAPAELTEARAAFGEGGADVVFELSGRPAALDLALGLAGPEGRVIVGSWYGGKRATVDLGTGFHRQRLSLIASQVSTVAPRLRGRWDKPRRLRLAAEWARRLTPSRLITHRFALAEAQRAYTFLDAEPPGCVQLVLDY